MKPRSIAALASLLGAGAAVAAMARARRLLTDLGTNPDPWTDLDLGPLDGTYTTVMTSDGAEIGAVVAGSGSDVVLSHGIMANTRFWTLVAPGLVESGHRVIAYDQRGHGGSTVGSEGISVERLGADLADVVDSLCEGPVIVAGHSMGAISILAFLVSDASSVTDVQAAVLVSPLARSRPFTSRIAKLGLDNYAGMPDNRDAARLGAMWTFGHRPPRSLVDLALDITGACPPTTVRAAGRGLVSFDLREKLHTVMQPVHIICGRRDRVTPARFSREIADLIDGSTVSWLDDEGHQLPLTAPDTIVGAVLDLALLDAHD